MSERKKAIYALENGRVFVGEAFGASKTVVGEAVFNTSLTGYQEILTDPSYYRQIVTMTASEIGNYGVNREDVESDGPKVTGFVVHELCLTPSNWRSEGSLDDYLKGHDIPGIKGVDTRLITKNLRHTGVMKACLSTEGISAEEAIERARAWPGLEGIDLIEGVTCKAPYIFEETPAAQWAFFKAKDEEAFYLDELEKEKRHVVVFDFGVKRSILLNLKHIGFEITVVPAYTTTEEVDAINPDAVFLSNGPGDPSALLRVHQVVRELMQKYPIFGICLGHQCIAHALGGETYKLKFGHRGANQPVKNIEEDSVVITSQNHGYAVKPEGLENTELLITEYNLNDGTIAGLRHKHLPVFSVQYHPEASPGPRESSKLFKRFYDRVLAQEEASLLPEAQRA